MSERRIFDVSLRIGSGLPTWPGDPKVSVRPASRIAAGDPANVSELHLGTHTGTHVDPPSHFLDGAPAADALSLDILMGQAVVADLRSVDGAIEPADLDRLALPEDVTRLLLRTPNSEIWRDPAPAFPDRYTSLSVAGARWVVERGIRLVGIDFLSIEPGGEPDFPVHRTLLGAGVVIVEGLDLGSVEPGGYTLACLPLRIGDGDGAPARAVLVSP